MGQYWNIVNITKKQYLDPAAFGDGVKIMEFALSSHGTLTALAILLTGGSNGQSSGDFEGRSPLVGSWAGDQIVIAGDYGADGVFLTEEEEGKIERKDREIWHLYRYANRYYQNISQEMRDLLRQDASIQLSSPWGRMAQLQYK